VVAEASNVFEFLILERGVMDMPHIILFEDGGFFGNHKHVFGEIENLATDHDSNFNDKTSSFVILDGTWEFFKDFEWKNPYKNGSTIITLGTGAYPSITAVLGSGSNDSLTGLRPVNQ
jgi:hypothetical protein